MRHMRLLRRMLTWAVGGFLVGFCAMVLIDRPAAARLATAPVALQPQAGERVFASDAGIMVKFVKREKVVDFEATVAKLKDALERSASSERRRQAATWKVFRAVAPATNGDAVYVFVMDPAIKGADYGVSRILAEAFPVEAPTLYRRYADSFSTDQNIVDMTLVASLGQ